MNLSPSFESSQLQQQQGGQQQLKTETPLDMPQLDFEFTLDLDHRKRRRNRTTQSCLNCHTSKRKCDRKRPCQRCIQLGLTGLCVYEIDDPALRDDPNVDETTRLRNRIAELESLVRELRGKPHPRWADASFCDGDPAEKWHSRAAKRPPMQLNLRRQRDALALGQMPPPNPLAGSHYALTSPSVKSEPGDSSTSAHFPFRFSPSPDSATSSPYAMFPPQTQGYDAQQQQQQAHHQMAYQGSPADSFYNPYSQQPHVAFHTDAGDGRYTNNGQHAHVHSQGHPSPGGGPFCACLTNPAAAHTLISLSQQLRNALQRLMTLPEHGAHACVLMRQIQVLNDVLHSCLDHSGNHSFHSPSLAQHQQHLRSHPPSQHSPQHHQPPQHHPSQRQQQRSTYSDQMRGYEGSTPPDSDVMTPLSSTESAGHGHVIHEEWATALAQAQGGGYNPYFPPLPPSEKGGGGGMDMDMEEYQGVM